MSSRICSGSSAGALNYKAIVNDGIKGNNFITEVAASKHKEAVNAQIGWGHSIGKVTLSSVGFLTPIVSSIAIPTLLAWEYFSNGGVSEYVTGRPINFLADTSEPTHPVLEGIFNCAVESSFKLVNGTYTSAAHLTQAAANLALESGSSTPLVAGGAATTLALAGSRFGLNPLDMTRTVTYTATHAVTSVAHTVFNYVTWMYGASVLATAHAIKNSVATSYDKKAQQAEELTKTNHKDAIASLTDTYNGIGKTIDDGFEEIVKKYKKVGALEDKELIEKYEFAQGVTRFQKKLPEMVNACKAMKLNGKSFLSDTDIERVLEKVKGSTKKIEISLVPDLEHTEKAMSHNYNLLVKLPVELGVENCVPQSVDVCLEEVKNQRLGWMDTVSSIGNAIGSTAIAGAIPPVLTFAALEASKFAGYMPVETLAGMAVQQGLPVEAREVGVAFSAVAAATALLGMKSVLSRKWSAYAQRVRDSEAAVQENKQKAQNYLSKAFNDVAAILKPQDKAIIEERIPLWEAEVKKYPGLDSAAALAALKKAVGELGITGA